MSTAGKVLSVLILVASLVWVTLAAGVDQLDRNANRALVDLRGKVVKLQDDIKDTQDLVAQTKDQTTLMQEEMDRGLAVIFARQNDVQRNASTIRELLTRVQYELTTVQHTVETAEKARNERAAERVQEQRDLDQVTAEVADLKAKDAELRARLQSLRDEFRKTFALNSDALKKAVR
jgi:chromosome segregation ATPase